MVFAGHGEKLLPFIAPGALMISKAGGHSYLYSL
jgi:hypothetical protein